MTQPDTNLRRGQYLALAHSHITRAVAAMDSCFALIWGSPVLQSLWAPVRPMQRPCWGVLSCHCFRHLLVLGLEESEQSLISKKTWTYWQCAHLYIWAEPDNQEQCLGGKETTQWSFTHFYYSFSYSIRYCPDLEDAENIYSLTLSHWEDAY